MDPKNQDPNRFETAGQEKPPGLVREFLDFLKETRKWWLLPLILMLLLLAGLLLLGGTAAAPFIYTLF